MYMTIVYGGKVEEKRRLVCNKKCFSHFNIKMSYKNFGFPNDIWTPEHLQAIHTYVMNPKSVVRTPTSQIINL